MIYLKNNTKKQTFYIRRNFDWNFNVVPFKRQEKDFTATRNGNYTIVADDDYTVMTQVNLEVALPFEEKTVDITEDGTTEILPSKDYDGMSKVVVNTNTQGKIDPVKSETYTKNGKYQVRPSEGQYGIAGVDVEVALPFEEKAVDITRNGITEILPSSEFDGMQKVTVNTKVMDNVGERQTLDITKNGVYEFNPTGTDSGIAGATANVKIPFEEKTIQISENGQTTVVPSENFEGIEKVIINTDIQPKLQTKTTKVNGEVIPSKGYYGLGKVIVDVPQIGGGNIDLAGTGWEDEETFYVDIDRIRSIERDLNYTREKYAVWNPATTSTKKLYYEDADLIYAPKVDMQNVTEMGDITGGMFTSCSNLYSIPRLNISKIQDMSMTFWGCVNLKIVPPLDYSSVKKLDECFDGCENLTHLEPMNTVSLERLYNTFRDCTKLKYAPEIITTNVYTMYGLYNGCTNLISVPEMDATSLLVNGFVFFKCPNLTYFGGFKNLKTSLELYHNPKLTHQSLMNVINKLGNAHPDFDEGKPILDLGAENFDKLTEEEILIAVNKGWIVER